MLRNYERKIFIYEEYLKQNYENDYIPYIVEYIDTVLSKRLNEDEILELVQHDVPAIKLYNRADFDMFNIASFAFCSFDNITPGTENSYGFYKSKDNKYILEQLMFKKKKENSHVQRMHKTKFYRF